MVSTLQILISLLAVIAAVGVASKRSKVPPAILLVVTGVVLALIPGLPAIELAPQLVLLLILPPIIYMSAVAMSWREFRFNLRPIVLLAFGSVIFTTVAIAAAFHWLLGFPWAVGFVLGAIVSPPDAVAPLSIARRMQLPRRILVILEGEGLVNDATALILYRFAVGVVSYGVFSFSQAAGLFAAIVVGEILWGIGVGWMMLRLRRWVADPRIEIALSVLTPFLAYWPPEHLGGSGVLATVTTGLYVSWNGPRLISAATRLQGIFFWDFILYLVEGLVFLITGLQARTLVERIGEYSIGELTMSAILVTVVVIAARFIWVYPATYIPRWISPALAPPGPLAALAVALPPRLHRRARHRLAGCRPGHSLRHRDRPALSRPRPDSLSHLPDHSRDPGGPRPDAACGNPLAGPGQCRASGAPRGAGRGAAGPAGSHPGGDRTAQAARETNAISRKRRCGRCAAATATGSNISSSEATAMPAIASSRKPKTRSKPC